MSHVSNPSSLSILSSAQRLPAVATWAVTFAAVVTTWDNRRRTRKHLSKVPDHRLSDIGLDATTARAEAAKPAWVE